MKALVTGGGGFLGKAIVQRLRQRRDHVTSFARGAYPELEQLGVSVVRGDLVDVESVAAAARGCDIVFHVAAKAGLGGRYRDYHAANVIGTKNVLKACLQNGVSRLVYTSSPSVVFDGRDMEGIDESIPYADHFEAHYPKTKAIAEKMVLDANGDALATVALRPHLIWGPGDNHLIPRIIARAKSGRLRQIGSANKLIDTVFIDNAADAHILAADHLAPGTPVAGKAYFISQGDPRPLWEMINAILNAAEIAPITKRVPFRVAYSAAWLVDTIWRLFYLSMEPPVSRFLVRELSTAHWFNIDAARRDFGYDPQVTIEEGLQRLPIDLQNGSLSTAN